MAFDISLGETPPVEAPRSVTFAEFYDTQAHVIGLALALSCDDADLTDQALLVALVSSAQRWKYLAYHPNPVGWALRAGLDEAAKEDLDHPPSAVNADRRLHPWARATAGGRGAAAMMRARPVCSSPPMA